MFELIFDFVSVNAYLALNPAKQLADELGIELNLIPLRTTSELHFLATAPAEKDGTVSDRHRRVKAEYTYQDALRYANVQGLDIKIAGADSDSTLALRGQLIANSRDKGFEYAAATFKDYWCGEHELNEPSDVSRVLQDCGIEGFDLMDSRWDLDGIKAEMDSREVYMVPTFWVDGERYMGRQHLPMIKWQLTNYEGPGPL